MLKKSTGQARASAEEQDRANGANECSCGVLKHWETTTVDAAQLLTCNAARNVESVSNPSKIRREEKNYIFGVDTRRKWIYVQHKIAAWRKGGVANKIAVLQVLRSIYLYYGSASGLSTDCFKLAWRTQATVNCVKPQEGANVGRLTLSFEGHCCIDV